MTIKRRTVALKFSCGLASGELKDVRAMLGEAAALSAVADEHDLVYHVREVSVDKGIVEIVVALDGFSNVPDAVQKTIELVDSVLEPRAVDGSTLSLLSAKVRRS